MPSWPYLICCQYSEGVNDLFCGVDVGGFAGHEVEEAIELDEPAGVRVDDGQDALEVNLPLEKTKVNLINETRLFVCAFIRSQKNQNLISLRSRYLQ